MTQSVTQYTPGTEWLYLRIYGGPIALEEWLTGSFRILLGEWIRSDTVRLFHFVRYLDQDYHLRLRFKLADPLQTGLLLNILSSDCRTWIEEERFWKIEAGTYEPELNRYGAERMGLIEKWFHEDSLFWLDRLTGATEDEQAVLWKTVVARIDWIFERFGLSMKGRQGLLQQMRESLSAEFRINHAMKSQLDAKYRILSGQLADALRQPATAQPVSDQGMIASISAIRHIVETFGSLQELEASGILPDLIHMSLNRAFRTRHRLQELVIYDFLARYYVSEVARRR